MKNIKLKKGLWYSINFSGIIIPAVCIKPLLRQFSYNCPFTGVPLIGTVLRTDIKTELTY